MVLAQLTQCDPNCYIEKWLLCGSEHERNAEFQLGMYALRDIAAGEELTYNYGAYIRRTLTQAGPHSSLPSWVLTAQSRPASRVCVARPTARASLARACGDPS